MSRNSRRFYMTSARQTLLGWLRLWLHLAKPNQCRCSKSIKHGGESNKIHGMPVGRVLGGGNRVTKTDGSNTSVTTVTIVIIKLLISYLQFFVQLG